MRISDWSSDVCSSDLHTPVAYYAGPDMPGGASRRVRSPGQELPGQGAIVLHGKRILLVISGGIAAYKALDLIRRLRERGASVRCVMSKSAHQFVTPLSVAALSGDKVYDSLFSP